MCVQTEKTFGARGRKDAHEEGRNDPPEKSKFILWMEGERKIERGAWQQIRPRKKVLDKILGKERVPL